LSKSYSKTEHGRPPANNKNSVSKIWRNVNKNEVIDVYRLAGVVDKILVLHRARMALSVSHPVCLEISLGTVPRYGLPPSVLQVLFVGFDLNFCVNIYLNLSLQFDDCSPKWLIYWNLLTDDFKANCQ